MVSIVLELQTEHCGMQDLTFAMD